MPASTSRSATWISSSRSSRAAACVSARTPKARFAYLFPSSSSALISVRLKPGLSDASRAHAIALIRQEAPCPIASGETLLERRDFRPYFENYAFDTAIVDVIWNGFYESLKIAAMADVYEVNVAPHNFYGHLASAMSAHFCAAVPNFRIMEIDIDSVRWRDEFFTVAPTIDDGERPQ